MTDGNFGMFFCNEKDGVLNQKAPSVKEAPWIVQLKSVFTDVEDKVTPYATKDSSFNDMGEEIDRVARIYFVVNEGDYRIFGLAQGVGEKGRATFSSEKIAEVINNYPGKAFDIHKNDNATDITPFIKLVEANGEASQEVIEEFIKLKSKLLQKLGISLQ